MHGGHRPCHRALPPESNWRSQHVAGPVGTWAAEARVLRCYRIVLAHFGGSGRGMPVLYVNM